MNPYETGLGRIAANHVPPTFLARAAAVHPVRTAVPEAGNVQAFVPRDDAKGLAGSA